VRIPPRYRGEGEADLKIIEGRLPPRDDMAPQKRPRLPQQTGAIIFGVTKLNWRLDEVGLEHYRRAGEMLIESKEQVPYGY
jgi:hypothetical protein